MKISIYFDVYPWTEKPSDIWPTMTPQKKPEGAIRYRVDADINPGGAVDKIIAADEPGEDIDGAAQVEIET